MPPPTLSLAGLRVFISYPRGGHAHTWAERAHAYLHGLGVEAFRDEQNVEEGEPSWYRAIEQALHAAHVVLALVGHDTAQSRWQIRELNVADNRRIPVVVLRIEPSVELPWVVADAVPIELRANHWAATCRAVEKALQTQRQARSPAAAAAEAAGATSQAEAAERQRERDYLSALLAGELADHSALYVEVAGIQRRAPTLARSHRALPASLRRPPLANATSLLRPHRPPAGAATETQERSPELDHHAPAVNVNDKGQPFTDVLDAYRSLRDRTLKRLVVLGEPGAGKSFSLQRIAVELAAAALADATAPLPVLARLGLWTGAEQPLAHFIETEIGPFGPGWQRLRDEGRALLMLDGLNEIPSHQRAHKAEQVRQMAQDTRWAAVLVSCRERDFTDDFAALPFDRLTLQPLTPLQIHDYLRRSYVHDRGEADGVAAADARFWQMAGGAELAEVWAVWEGAGASFELFWAADDVPRENPNVYNKTSGAQDQRWRDARDNPRSLLALGSNPYLLTLMRGLDPLPTNRAELFAQALHNLHARESEACDRRHDAAAAPELQAWMNALTDLAAEMQHRAGTAAGDGGDDGDALNTTAPEAPAPSASAGTSLPETEAPPSLTQDLIRFSIDASVLQRSGASLRFTHQLLQESLAARPLLDACLADDPPASQFWPRDRWWEPTGWDVVAELAAEACTGDDPLTEQYLRWLTRAQPELAARAWRLVGSPRLTTGWLDGELNPLQARLTDVGREPSPLARAAIGRALAAFDADQRSGVGLRADGLPDIEWVAVDDTAPWIYQGQPHDALPRYALSRYPVTHRQFQAFIDAGSYADDRWWQGLADHPEAATPAKWPDANAPRERVSWFEAMAYCRWLSDALGLPGITLPTEKQWERAAAGLSGAEYPWGDGYRQGCANINETWDKLPGAVNVGRTTAVGLYPHAGRDSIEDLSGNVWEWCVDAHDPAEDPTTASRVVRGGSWYNLAKSCRAAYRYHNPPDYRSNNIGFRLCVSSPIKNRRPPRR